MGNRKNILISQWTNEMIETPKFLQSGAKDGGKDCRKSLLELKEGEGGMGSPCKIISVNLNCFLWRWVVASEKRINRFFFLDNETEISIFQCWSTSCWVLKILISKTVDWKTYLSMHYDFHNFSHIVTQGRFLGRFGHDSPNDAICIASLHFQIINSNIFALEGRGDVSDTAKWPLLHMTYEASYALKCLFQGILPNNHIRLCVSETSPKGLQIVMISILFTGYL